MATLKKTLTALLILFIFSACGEKELILSDANCKITYHESYAKIAKDIQLYEQMEQESTSEKKQFTYSILNEGDGVVFNISMRDQSDIDKNSATGEACYYQRKFLVDKKVKFQFTDNAQQVELTLNSDELPVSLEQTNFLLLVDREMDKADMQQLEVFAKDKSLPQEASFWLKKGDDGEYICYTIFYDQTTDTKVLQEVFSRARIIVKKLNALGLKQKVQSGFMSLDYKVIDI